MAAILPAAPFPAVPPPAPAPVIVVSLPAVNGARPFAFSAAEPLVVATPFLSWVSIGIRAGVPQVTLNEWQMINAFSRKARGGPDAASQAALANRSVLTLQLSDAWWSAYLTELVASGLLRMPMAVREDLMRMVKDIIPANPANLLVLAADWAVCEEFDIPGIPGVPGLPGRARIPGRGGRAAVAAVPPVPPVLPIAPTPGPAELVFLHLADLSLLEDNGAAEPWASVARASGMLGAAATQAVRIRVMSNVRRTAAQLKAAVARHLGLDASPANDAPIAGALGSFLAASPIPTGLEAHGVSEAELALEAADAFRAQRSKTDLLAVEESRFHLVEPRSALLARGSPPPPSCGLQCLAPMK